MGVGVEGFLISIKQKKKGRNRTASVMLKSKTRVKTRDEQLGTARNYSAYGGLGDAPGSFRKKTRLNR